MRALAICSISLSLTTLAACSTIGHVPPPVVQTKVEREVPSQALLQLCAAEPQVPTRKVRDLQTNREAWHESFDKCAARMCRLVQWIVPVTVCPDDAKPSDRP